MHTKPFPLATTVRGTGEPAVLLVPGWCGDRTVFDDLVAGLGSHRRAISVDLPGHGESTATHHDYTTGDVVDSLQAALEDAGVDRVVPVLLSHAGWAGIELRVASTRAWRAWSSSTGWFSARLTASPTHCRAYGPRLGCRCAPG